MSSAKFDRIVFVRAQKMQAPLFLLIFDVLVAKTLQYQVRFLWLIETYHVDLLGILKFDSFGEQHFTDFTLEFREVVSRSDPNDFLLYLTEHPVLQAAHVDKLATALTVARVYKGVILTAFLAKTNFTASLQIALDLINVSIQF